MSNQALRPDQCAQLVEAIRLADIPAELDKQISVLKRTGDEHNVKQDEQLEIIKTLRTQLGGLMSTLQTSLGNTSVESPQDSPQDVGRLASLLEGQVGSLEATMKDQEQTIEELKKFLEDKVLKQKADKAKSDESSNSWPSATISAAYFGSLLLSSVVSTCTATLVNRQP
jgi:hypothetical protein